MFTLFIVRLLVLPETDTANNSCGPQGLGVGVMVGVFVAVMVEVTVGELVMVLVGVFVGLLVTVLVGVCETANFGKNKTATNNVRTKFKLFFLKSLAVFLKIHHWSYLRIKSSFSNQLYICVIFLKSFKNP